MGHPPRVLGGALLLGIHGGEQGGDRLEQDAAAVAGKALDLQPLALQVALHHQGNVAHPERLGDEVAGAPTEPLPHQVYRAEAGEHDDR